jgi:hypothetical protein
MASSQFSYVDTYTHSLTHSLSPFRPYSTPRPHVHPSAPLSAPASPPPPPTFPITHDSLPALSHIEHRSSAGLMTHQSRMTSKVHRNALSPAQPASCLARSSPRLSSPRHTAPLPSGLVNGAGTTGGQAARPSHACVAIRSFMHAAGLPSPTLRGTCHTVHLVEVGRLIACPALPAQFVQTAHASRFGLVAPTIQSVEEVTDLIYVPGV